MKSLIAVLMLVAAAASAAPICSVEVVDTANHTTEVFTVTSKTSGSSSALYSVSGSKSGMETAVVSAPDAPIDGGGGVPRETPNQILKTYGAGADAALGAQGKPADVPPLRLKVVGGSCDRFQVSFILFWINEWFYFG